MVDPAQSEATYEDLLQAPPQLVAEILYGRLHTHPRPAPEHAHSASALRGKLFDALAAITFSLSVLRA